MKDLTSIPLKYFPNQDNQILISSLLDVNNNLLSRNYFIEGEWKHKHLNKANIKYDLANINSEDYLKITTDKIAFFVDIQHPEYNFSDRGFILLPGEEKKLLKLSSHSGDKINLGQLEINILNNYLDFS